MEHRNTERLLLDCACPLTESLLIEAERRSYRSNHPWPLTLILEDTRVQKLDEKYREYKPHSNFLIEKSSLPRFLVKNDSAGSKEDWPVDKVRLILEGAAIVRFANTFVDTFKQKRDFVLIAVYIGRNGYAEAFTLFQKPNDQKEYGGAMTGDVCVLYCFSLLTAG